MADKELLGLLETVNVLHDRQPEKGREYLWPIRLFFVARKSGPDWKIRHIQFSLPHNDPFADARFSEHTYFEKLYNKETALFAEHSNLGMLEPAESAFWQDFCDTCLCTRAAPAILAGKYFDPSVLFVDSCDRSCQGEESVIARFSGLREY